MRSDRKIWIRSAERDEAAFLSDLAYRSKAYWGYSKDFMEACREELAWRPMDSPHSPAFVLLLAGRRIGFCSLEQITLDTVDLGHLFVEPDCLGQGFGRRLLNHAVAMARERGYRRLLIQGDPNAEGFYSHCGARRIGTKPSGSITGRSLPLFEIDLVGP
jgi:GNAT superfamily N-acetyltransferase